MAYLRQVILQLTTRVRGNLHRSEGIGYDPGPLRVSDGFPSNHFLLPQTTTKTKLFFGYFLYHFYPSLVKCQLNRCFSATKLQRLRILEELCTHQWDWKQKLDGEAMDKE